MYKDRTSLLFIFTAFVTGLCGAFFIHYQVCLLLKNLAHHQ